MLRRAGKYLAVLIPVVLALSCTSLPRSGTPGEGGETAVEPLRGTDAIPLEWGTLVSMTPHPSASNASLLWLRDEAGDIRLVVYSHGAQRLWDKARVIRRR